jgi:hypothetical protein
MSFSLDIGRQTSTFFKVSDAARLFKFQGSSRQYGEIHQGFYLTLYYTRLTIAVKTDSLRNIEFLGYFQSAIKIIYQTNSYISSSSPACQPAHASMYSDRHIPDRPQPANHAPIVLPVLLNP